MTYQDDRLSRSESNLEKLEALIQRNSDEITQSRKDIVELSKKWDERFYQLTKDNLNISRTIIIIAGAAIIFSPLLREISPMVSIQLITPASGDMTEAEYAAAMQE